MKGLKALYASNKVTLTYCLLWPILFFWAGLYAFFLFILKFLYRAGILKSYRSRLTIISVGNITLGGTGKTPFVVFLAKKLCAEGKRVAIILRGYKRPKEENRVGVSTYYILGDEASMLCADCKEAKVITGRDRVAKVRQLEREQGLDTVILDDGFQHWRLKRDLDIVMISATSPFGNAQLLPLGPMRETFSSLRRADVFCLTHSDEVPLKEVERLEALLGRLKPGALVCRAIHACDTLYDLRTGQKVPFAVVSGEGVCLMCGIGQPSSFVHTAQKLKLVPKLEVFFDDHHEYTVAEIESIVARCRDSKIRKIVTTEKDAQRMAGCLERVAPGVDFLVLKIVLSITKGEEGLDGRLRALYSA